MIKTATIIAITSLALIGCASKTPTVYPPFDQEAYRPFATPGSATVSGQAFLVTKGGDIKRGAARQVFLIPDTVFFSSRVKDQNDWYTSFDQLGWTDTDSETIGKAWGYTKIVVADVDGKFRFTNVPAGKYVVETQLFWQYVSCGLFGCSNSDTGAVLRKRIEVTEGATVEAQLTSVINR